MAKPSTGRVTAAKVKSAAPPAAVGKKAKTTAVASNKKADAKKADAKNAGAKKAAAKSAAPKMAAAPKKSVTPKGASPKQAASVRKADAKKTPAPQKAVAKKAGPPKAPARKSPPPIKAAAKTVAMKKTAVRRPVIRTAMPTPAARRARTAAAPRKSASAPPRKAAAVVAPPPKPIGNPPQTFTVSHLNQDDFKADGLRAYAQYRDLGIAAATGGLCQAHVIRFVPPCTNEVRKRHTHAAELQLVYVLQGWMKNEFEGYGEQMMSAGSCWLQPSGIKHTVLDYSADCEVLEIIVPADFKTEDLT